VLNSLTLGPGVIQIETSCKRSFIANIDRIRRRVTWFLESRGMIR
jgi:hypothetical protein